MAFDRARDAVGVAGGEQVQERATEHREQERPLVPPGRRLAAARGLPGREQVKPVVDGVGGESGPRSRVAAQGQGIALRPQSEQRVMLRSGEPGPDLSARRGKAGVGGDLRDLPERGEVAEFVLAGAGEQGADQALLRAKQEQQDARARPDGLGQRTQRHVGEPAAQHVAVGGIEQFPLARGALPMAVLASMDHRASMDHGASVDHGASMDQRASPDRGRGHADRPSSYTWPIRSAPKLRCGSSSTRLNPLAR